MKIKDILIAIGISIGLAPIILVIVMHTTGFMQLKFGWQSGEKESKAKVATVKYSHYQESLAVLHSKKFKAFEAQRQELENRKRRNAEDENRLGELKKEISRKNDDLNKTRERLEEIVKASSELESRRLKQLASIYGSMRAEEAAPILYTMKNRLIVSILRRIGEDRQKAKIMAAMAKISKARAGKISKMLTDIKIK